MSQRLRARIVTVVISTTTATIRLEKQAIIYILDSSVNKEPEYYTNEYHNVSSVTEKRGV